MRNRRIIPFHLSRKGVVFLVILLLLVCGFSYAFFRHDARLDPYVKNLPDEETLNATPYNYELYIKRMAELYSKGDCEGVLKEVISYYDVFIESHGDTGILYYAQLCLNNLKQKDQLQSFVSKLKKKDILVLGLSLLEDGKTYAYKGYFMQELMKSHTDYFREMSLADDYYKEGLLDKKKTSKDKVNIFVDYAKHFPNNPKLLPYLDGEDYKKLRESIPKNKLADFDSISSRIKDNQYAKEEKVSYASIKDHAFAILKNTKEGLFFRNLYNFEGWEIVKVVGESQLLDEYGAEKKWCEVLFGGVHGFIESDKLEPYANVSGAEEIVKSEEILFNGGDLFKGLDMASKLMSRSNDFLKERGIVLFYYFNKKIKNRATSKNNNPYLDYVLKYPKYFQASSDGDYLEMSPVLFNYFASLYPKSSFRELFLREDFDF